MTAVFNINDAGIQVALAGDLLRTSPGYALLNKGELITGERASQHARLLPMWTNNRFWSQLTTNSLPNATGQVRHHADLAFAHLEDLWLPIKKEAGRAIFIVPGYYSNDNLGLLLGMARESGIPVSGLVDHSVLAACDLPLRPTVLHLDIHLHAITLTRISNTGQLTRKNVKTITETGLYTLWDRWAHTIANQFIQATRFDPMHDAASEQHLFNLLPGWIAGLADADMHSFELEAHDTEHAVTIAGDNLLRECAPLYPQIVQAIRPEIPRGEKASLLISHRFKGFPGFKRSLELIPNLDLIDLPETAAIDAALLYQDEIATDSNAVSHTLQLSGGKVLQANDREAARATHLLWNHRACAIGSGLKLGGDFSRGPAASDEPVCTLYPRNNDLLLELHQPTAVRLNGKAATSGASLQPGDLLEIAGEALTLILVEDHG